MPTSLTTPSTRVAGKVLLAGVAVISVATSAPPPVPPPNVPMWSIASKPLPLACGAADVWVAKSGKTGLGITVRITPNQQVRPSQAADASGVAPRPSQIAVDPTTPTPTNAPLAVTPGATNLPAPTHASIAVDPGVAADPCSAVVGATLRFSDRAFTGQLALQQRGLELQAPTAPHDGVDARVPDPSLLGATYYYLGFELDNEARWNRGDRTATIELTIDVGGKRETWSLPATHAYREWPSRRR